MIGSLWLAVTLFTWTVWSAVSLLRNYRIACQLNLPIVISPVNPLNIFWLLLCQSLNIYLIFQRFPGPLGEWAKYCFIGWQFKNGRDAHDRYGPAFVLCTPGLNEVLIADPAAAHSILNRRKDFTKPAMIYEALNVFGRNLDSVEGETWQRHRKLTAPNFNEKVSSNVWLEASRQAGEMLHEWSSQSQHGITTLAEDTATVALHVLSSAGFGRRHFFKDAQQEAKPPYQMTYNNALRTVLQTFILLTILPAKWMSSPWMPHGIRKTGIAAQDFQSYMEEMVRQERRALETKESEGNNLISSLVRAFDEASNENKSSPGLADDELYGNIFVYNLAGHETTANALATAIVYLAAAPEWQEWLGSELDEIQCTANYETTFPRMKRCLAVMLETLRLHGSVVYIPKTTGQFPQSVSIAGHEKVIPGNTFVTVNSHALHCDTNCWGKDAEQWRPDRWIKQLDSGEDEELVEPQEGTFMPWADGPRVCPGKKFSQVEFVAVMATLFRKHRVRAVQLPSETRSGARSRLEAAIQDSAITGITLQIRKPDDIPLAWMLAKDLKTDKR